MRINEKLLFYLRDVLVVVAGNFLYAVGIVFFIIPGNLITGGTTGIGLFLRAMCGIPLSAFILGFNVLMFVIGWLILGKKFAATTAVSTFFSPLALQVVQYLGGDYRITEDPLLCTIFGGICIGLSLGIVIRVGASTGGMDIPPLVLHKLFGTSVSVVMYLFDIAILLLQVTFHRGEAILYGILLIAVYTFVLNECLIIGEDRIEIKIVSGKNEEIRAMILQEIDRGVTILNGKTGYLEEKAEIVLSVVSKKELPITCKKIKKIDPDAFMIISKVTEVRGRGFTSQKEYR